MDVGLGEGILVFHGQEVHDMFHLCLFIDTEPHCQIVLRIFQVVHLAMIWARIELGSSKVHHLYQTILQEILSVDRKFAVVRIPSRGDRYGCYHLDCATCPGPYEWQQ